VKTPAREMNPVVVRRFRSPRVGATRRPGAVVAARRRSYAAAVAVDVRSLSSRTWFLAVAGLVLAAAITLPFFFIGDSTLRLVVAVCISVATAIVAMLLARRLQRRDVARSAEGARVREALAETERRHRDLLEGLPLATWVYAPGNRGETREVGPQIATIVGYPAEEWSDELFTRILHPDDRERTRAEIGAALERGLPFQAEYRLVGRDGSIVWIREEGRTISGAEGEPVAGQSFLIDVGERKRMELERESLRGAERAAAGATVERQSRLDLLREVADVTAASVDSQATIERVAGMVVQAFADWCVVDLGEQGGSLKRLAVARAEPADETGGKAPDEEPSETVRAVVASGRPQVVPALGESSDGGGLASPLGEIDASSVICVPLRARHRSLGALTVARTRSGQAYGADDLAFVEDIAARVALAVDRARLYAEVEESADAARVLAHVADGVMLVDRSGTVRLWNPAAEAMTAIPAPDVVGRLAIDALPGWKEAADSVPVSVRPDPGHAEVVIPVETKKGERWIAISGVQFFGGTVYAFRDLTDVRRLEELKADFIATASHELRTPLAAVYGAAQTLLRHDFALDEGGRDRFVSLIADESERLGRIVNEILLASQLDAGRLELDFEPFDAIELVERVLEATRAHAPPDVVVERVVGDGLPRVDADRDKVRQVLVNLVENAIKYSPDGGRIELGVESHDDAVLFSVKDEGLGIPSDEQARVFEKFYRLDPHMTRGVGGTGLGLYICNELVSRMGGHIWVESTAGEGSTFFFELPAAAAGAVVPLTPAERIAQTED
jgi:PAS domain S-box-containing protein